MDRRSLPLNALRTFDAAARHLNFTRAAEELGVTHGAVSRQISALEATLATSLFVRDLPMRLTAEGQALFDGVSPALDAIAIAVDEASRRKSRSLVRVNAPPTFTMKWLIPRLTTFQRRFPEADVRLSTGTGEAQLSRLGDLDVIIRRVSSEDRADQMQPFLSGELACVCAPELMEGQALKGPVDLLQHRLIEAATNRTNWEHWFAAAGLPRPPESQFLRFEEMFYAVQAALDGLGIALIPLTLVADDLAAGSLAIPFMLPAATERDYCFGVAPARRQAPLTRAFVEWLVSEGAASNQMASEVLHETAQQVPGGSS
ncbi:LysR family transcriptional regulator [Ramlibacter sp. AW1]|uniref:LysR family transcriptional regulator n=1 Tax=Ramlibacter aurantiacus TaxID=2801330 RepID=A0A936ZY83_9BURK|nr:LysR substrate-binding domain-containing protein [Ramlibacter aurantiacus]MBL0422669.1 LysR family transcriptional regulator [Ramlibacter aurantiacus]